MSVTSWRMTQEKNQKKSRKSRAKDSRTKRPVQTPRSRSASRSTAQVVSQSSRAIIKQSVMEMMPNVSNRSIVRGMVSQLIDPLSGAKVRLPPVAAQSSTMTATALTSTFQVLTWLIPTDYMDAGKYVSPVVVDDVANAGTVLLTTPLWNLTEGIPMFQYWDPLFPVIRPAFLYPSAPVTYSCGYFTGAVGNGDEFLVAVRESAPVSYVISNMPINPQGFGLSTAAPGAGSHRPVTEALGKTWFWMDSNSTLTFSTIPRFSGAATAGSAVMRVFLRTDMDTEILIEDVASLATFVSGTSIVLTTTVPTSGWFRVDLTISNPVAAATGYMSLQNSGLSVTNSGTVQTQFDVNPSLLGELRSVESARLLGASLLTSCVSPQQFKGGKISAVAAHCCYPDWTQLSTTPGLVDTTRRISFYNGNFVSVAGEGRKGDGGLYSILVPKNYGVLPRGRYFSDLPNRGRIEVYHMDAFEAPDRPFGYNAIYLKPEFATLDSTPHVRLQMIAAQAIEFTTQSQVFNSLRPNAKSADWAALNDVLPAIFPFSPNPAHTGKIADILHTVGVVGSAVAPVGAAIALAAGNPEVAAILGIAEAGLATLANY